MNRVVKQWLAGLLAVGMAFTLLPAAAWAAADYDVAEGSVSLEGDGAYTVTGRTDANTITVTGGDVTLTLDNVTVTSADGCAFDIQAGNVTLILADDSVNTFESGNHYAGIHVAEDASLTIRGSGALYATANKPSENTASGAGIGGNQTDDAGSITIESGTVAAKSIGDGAGIGGGHANDEAGKIYGKFQSITITGGTVTAESTGNGAGIGCGCWAKGMGAITITGGEIHAKSGSPDGRSYDIGYGHRDGDFESDISITGGVIFTEGSHRRGIGADNVSRDDCLIFPYSGQGTCYGDPTLTGDITIPSGRTLTVPADSILTVAEGATLTVAPGAALEIEGAVQNNGAIDQYGEIDGEIGGNPPVRYELTVAAPSFDSLAEGYDQPEAEPVTIENTGNGTVTLSQVELSGGDFILGEGAVGPLAGGESNTTWTVQPAAGLECGHYEAELTVTCEDGVTAADTVSFDVLGAPVPYLDSDGAEKTCEVYRLVKSGETTWREGWYVVRESVTVDSRITVSGDVHLILMDGCTLTVNGGIDVSEDNALTIYGQAAGTGRLDATGNSMCGGIGGGQRQSCGAITINGGTIYAKGGQDGAGIGGGSFGAGGVITINGGTVTAEGGHDPSGYYMTGGAGIGGGRESRSGGTITINGGTVTATGCLDSAGIGGGGSSGYSPSSGGDITITGGTVTATGGGDAPGIGGGQSTSGRNLGASGSFSTGEDGNAVIHTNNGIQDDSGTDDWSGVVFEGDSGTVYGSPTLTEDLEIQDGQTLTVPEGSTLTVGDGATLTNNGGIMNYGTLDNQGTVANSGRIVNDGGATTGKEVSGTQPETPEYNLRVSNVTFENRAYGAQSEEKEILIRNTGLNDVTIESVTVGKGFELTAGDVGILAAGARNTSWKIKPQDNLFAGDYTAAITVTYIAGETTQTATAEAAVTVAKVGDAYEIPNAAALKAFRDYINSDNGHGQGESFVLTADIDLENEPWTPIGEGEHSFDGYFDGGGHTIRGLYIDAPASDNQGLFGTINRTVSNLRVEGSVTGKDRVGGIVGYNYSGSIENCSSGVTVKGESDVGGVAGKSFETSYCYNNGDVTGTNNVGGVVGNNNGAKAGETNSCYNTGTVTCSDDSGYCGGVVGKNDINFAFGGSVDSCYNFGAVIGGEHSGGIVGQNVQGENPKDDSKVNASVRNCFYLEGTATTGIREDQTGGSSATAKAEADFKSLASALGDDWADDLSLGRPVLVNNREPSPAGTEADPYLIPDLATLETVRDFVNAHAPNSEGRYFKLTADIDLSSKYGPEKESWTPIGDINTTDSLFMGTFDGGGHTISGVYIDASGGEIAVYGLFGGSEGTIRDLNVSEETITVRGGEAPAVGGIVGTSVGTVANCSSGGTIAIEGVTASYRRMAGYIGGIVGTNMGTVTDCDSAARVTFTADGGDAYAAGCAIGGIMGANAGFDDLATIENCRFTGQVTGTISGGAETAIMAGIGGIIGLNESMNDEAVNDVVVENCESSGTVTGTIHGGVPEPGTGVGGILGSNEAMEADIRVKNCLNTGAVSLDASDISGDAIGVGGIVGTNVSTNTTSATVERCCNSGTVTGTGETVSGAVVGHNLVENYSIDYESLMLLPGAATGPSAVKTLSAGAPTALTDAVTNCYYLSGAAAGGIGEGEGRAAEKSEAQFASGEVAWLLQNGQPTQVWGQALPADRGPVLTGEAAKAVHQVTFRAEGAEYAVRYANPAGLTALPAAPALAGLAFDHWSTENSASGERFDSATPVTGDITLYAVGRSTFGGESDAIALTTTYGTALTEDLSQYVRYESAPETPAAGKFTYTITAGNETLGAATAGDILTIPATANAGSYILTIQAAETEPEYTLMSVESYGADPVTLTVTVTIAKVDPEVTAPTPKTLTYTGVAQELVEAGKTTGGEMQYSLDGAAYSAAIPTGTDARTYTVWYQVAGDANHTDTTPDKVEVTIAKATAQVTTPPTPASAIYTGEKVALVSGGESNFGTLVYSLSEAGPFTGEIPTATEAGTYTVYYMVEGSDNWNASPVGHVQAEIKKAASSATVTGSAGLVYSGEPQPLVASGASDTGTVLYALGENAETQPESGAFTETIPTGADAGTYYVWWKILGDVDHGDSEPACVPVTIAKADPVVAAPTPKTLTYTGAVQELVEAGKTVGGTIQYSLDGVAYSAAIPTGTDAQTYTVWYQVTGDANHNDAAPQSVTVTIAKAEGRGSVTMADYLCGQTDVDPVAQSDTNGAEHVTYTYAARGADDYRDTKPTTAGEYTVKALFPATDNYNAVTATADFKITHRLPADLDESAEFTCDCASELRLKEAALTQVPPGLGGLYADVETLTRALADQVAAGANYAVFDVKLEVKEGTGAWHDAPEDSVPASGLTVTLPYPAGTNARYTFTAVHMFASGPRAGETETPAVTNTDQGITFTVTGLSPVCIGWTAPASSASSSRRGNYSVTLPAGSTGGAVTADSASAGRGSEVTLTVTPDAGYHLAALAVADRSGGAVALTDNGDGTYTFSMPAGPVAVEAEFTACGSARFADLDAAAWYHDYTDYVIAHNLMQGVSATTFAPDQSTTRAMVVTILYRLAGEPGAPRNIAFADVAPGLWYTDAISWAAANGIVEGYSQDAFGPDDPITREQLATILRRYAAYKGADVSGQADLAGYADASAVSDWAADAMAWAVQAGLLQGRSAATLVPGGTSTRAELAAVLTRCAQAAEEADQTKA